MSRIIDYTDRATCVLFGDGAGAMLLEPTTKARERRGIHRLPGRDRRLRRRIPLNMPAGGSRLPASCETVEKRMHYVHQDGQQVFKYAVRKMYDTCKTLLERNSIAPSDLKLMIPHQANRRIITATAERLGLGCEPGNPEHRPVRKHHGRDNSPGHSRCR